MKPYLYRIRLADTDAAGRIYFAAVLRIAHEAFEENMRLAGHDLAGMIGGGGYGLPVARVEADFRKELKLGSLIHVETKVEEIGKTSMTFRHNLKTERGDVAATVAITHVAVSSKTGKPVAIPVSLKNALT